MNDTFQRKRNLQGKFIKSDVPSPFNKEKYQKEYYRKNSKRISSRAVEWGRRNKKKRDIAKKKWAIKNREKVNFLKRLYIYRKKNAIGSHTREQLKELYEQHPLCPYCNQRKPNTIDHIFPLSRGGTNDISNLVPVCVSCNSSKGDKTVLEWRPMIWWQFNYLSRRYA